MRETGWIKILWWPEYRLFRHEINEAGKTRKLWVTAKTVPSELVRSGRVRKLSEVDYSYEGERDLPCFEFRAMVVITVSRCPVAE